MAGEELARILLGAWHAEADADAACAAACLILAGAARRKLVARCCWAGVSEEGSVGCREEVMLDGGARHAAAWGSATASTAVLADAAGGEAGAVSRCAGPACAAAEELVGLQRVEGAVQARALRQAPATSANHPRGTWRQVAARSGWARVSWAPTAVVGEVEVIVGGAALEAAVIGVGCSIIAKRTRRWRRRGWGGRRD